MELPDAYVWHDLEQGTDEWLMARLGVPTASEFDAIMTQGRGGKPSQMRLTYMAKLAGERLTDEPSAKFDTWDTKRGHALEPEARALYAMLTESEPEIVGFISRGKIVGASPDALVGSDGLLEIKSRLPHLQIPVILSGEVPAEHRTQLQIQLWVADRVFVDYFSYSPGMRPFMKRVYRDEEFIARAAVELARFHEELDDMIAKVRA